MQLNDLPYDVFQFVTKKFQISITEDQIKSQSSVDQLVEYIAEKVKINRSGFTNAFLFEFHLLKKFNTHFNADFSLQDHPEVAIPQLNRKKVWEELENETNYKLPVLVLPKTLNTLLSFLAVILTLGTLIFSTIMVGMDIFSGWIYLSALAGVLLTFLIYSTIGPQKKHIKFDTMSDLIKGVFLLNHKTIKSGDFIPGDKELEEKIKTILLQNFKEKDLNEKVFQ